MRLGTTGLGFSIALLGLLGRAAAEGTEGNTEAAMNQVGQDLKKVLDSKIDETTEEVVHQAQDLANKMKGNGSSDGQEAQGVPSGGDAPGAGFGE